MNYKMICIDFGGHDEGCSMLSHYLQSKSLLYLLFYGKLNSEVISAGLNPLVNASFRAGSNLDAVV